MIIITGVVGRCHRNSPTALLKESITCRVIKAPLGCRCSSDNLFAINAVKSFKCQAFEGLRMLCVKVLKFRSMSAHSMFCVSCLVPTSAMRFMVGCGSGSR
ncbi:hypothetical protein M758_10G168600 [Ceratodon purpureus]|nr:hypothetical protein M758_10G168600 [Ceratodon purpureus]